MNQFPARALRTRSRGRNALRRLRRMGSTTPEGMKVLFGTAACHFSDARPFQKRGVLRCAWSAADRTESQGVEQGLTA